MSRYISDRLRQLVAERANHRCEYCRLPARFSFFEFHIDHIISLKHGGPTTEANLAFACQICNLNKGTDIATSLAELDRIVRFFNPRKDSWHQHFEIDENGLISPLSLLGEATIKIFDFNHVEGIIERQELMSRHLF